MLYDDMIQTAKINLNRIIISALASIVFYSMTYGQTSKYYENLCSIDSILSFNKKYPDSLSKIKNFLDKSCWQTKDQSNSDTIDILCIYISDDNLHNIYDNSNFIKKTKEVYSYPDTGGAGSIILYESNYGICYYRAFSEMVFIPIKIIDFNNVILKHGDKKIEYNRLIIK